MRQSVVRAVGVASRRSPGVRAATIRRLRA